MIGFAAVAAISMLAGLVRLQGGFGYSLLVFPVLAVLASPTIAFALCILMELLFGLHTWLFDRRGKTIGLSIVHLAAFGLAGLAGFRLFALPYLDTLWVWRLGILASFAGGMLLLFRPMILPVNRITVATSAAASGVLGAACGIAGPPILLLFFADLRNDWVDIRAGLAAYFSLLYVGIAIGRWDVLVAAYPDGLTYAAALTGGVAAAGMITAIKRIDMPTSHWARLAGTLVIIGCLAAAAFRYLEG